MGTAVIGAPEFRARNGLIVRPCDNGGVEVGKPGYRDYTPPEATFALEEFFQAKRDEELGRWRHPQNPDYVVYPLIEDRVRVLREASGTFEDFSRDDASPTSGWIPRAVAFAYFEAHPERKPWEDAKPGEVWALTLADGSSHTLAVLRTSAGHWQLLDAETDTGYLHVRDHEIADGRRIWPEDAS